MHWVSLSLPTHPKSLIGRGSHFGPKPLVASERASPEESSLWGYYPTWGYYPLSPYSGRNNIPRWDNIPRLSEGRVPQASLSVLQVLQNLRSFRFSKRFSFGPSSFRRRTRRVKAKTTCADRV